MLLVLSHGAVIPFLLAVISAAAALGYALIMRWYGMAWKKLPEWQTPADFQPSTSVAVLIPARNEAANLDACLQAILRNKYPPELLEIVVIDDFSEDATADRATLYASRGVQLLRMADEPSSMPVFSHKKRAIERGIRHTSGHLIITSDADCEVPPGWLAEITGLYERNRPKMIAGPVACTRERNFFERFQSLDLIGMMGITGAGIGSGKMHMGNGANLAYERAAFEAVNGFQGVDHLASGDDMLLMEKIASRFPGEVAFLKSPRATVLTRALPDLRGFFSQRLRWASKSTQYREWKVTAALAWVLAFCCLIWSWLLLTPFWGLPALGAFLGLLGWKSLVDFFYLKPLSAYFGRPDLMRSFWTSQVLHTLYIALIGLWSNVQKRYVWKGRTVR